MPKLTRSNLTASFVLHSVTSTATRSNEYITKRSSPNMHAGRALRELYLFYEVRKIEFDPLTEPALYGGNFFGAKKYFQTGNFPIPGAQPTTVQIPDYTIDAQISTITYTTSNPDVIEFVPYSEFVPGADSKLMCAFIKETHNENIAADQSLGTVTATITTVDGLTTKCTGNIYAQEAYTGANPSTNFPVKMKAEMELYYGTEEEPVNPPIERTIVRWVYTGATQTGFQIYASSNGTSSWGLRGTATSTERFFADTPSTSKIYYKVRAKNGATYYPFGEVVMYEAVHTTAPIAPATFKVAINCEAPEPGQSNVAIALQFSWQDKSAIGQGGEDEFEIEYCKNGGAWTPYRIVERNTTEYRDWGVDSIFYGGLLKFRIRAKNNIGSSAWVESTTVYTRSL